MSFYLATLWVNKRRLCCCLVYICMYVYLSVCLSIHLSICPSVTFVYCIQMVEDIVKLLSPPDSPVILVL